MLRIDLFQNKLYDLWKRNNKKKMSTSAAVTNISKSLGLHQIISHLYDNNQLYWQACATYLSYFGVKYIASDIDRYCKNYLNTFIFKIITLYAIMYSSVNDMQIAFIMTCFIFIITHLIGFFTDDSCNHINGSQQPPLEHNNRHSYEKI